MAKLQIVLVAYCLMQICLAGRLPRDESSSESSESVESNESKESHESHEVKANELGLTLDQFHKFTSIRNNNTDQSVAGRLTVAKQLCAVLNIEPNAEAELSASQQEHFLHLIAKVRSLPNSKQIALLSVTCEYLNDPVLHENKAKSMRLPLGLYHKFETLKKIHTDRSPAGRVTLSRKLCQVYSSIKQIANVAEKEAAELTEEQFIHFEEILSKAINASNTEKPKAFRAVCVHLNETVSEEEQAKELGISVNLYNQIDAARQNNIHDTSTKGRLNAVREICGGINRYEGFSTASSNVTELSAEQLEQFQDLLKHARAASNAEKIPLLRDTCVFLNETRTIEKLAEEAGLTVEQLNKVIAIRTRNTDQSLTGKLAVVRQICKVVNAAETTDAAIETSTHSDAELSDDQLKQFEKKLTQINSAAIKERVPLLRETCEIINGKHVETSTPADNTLTN